MDNAMVKRGIGAVVLAIIAALLLGYLLKDKSRERQDVVEMKLPGAPEMNIPSLTEGLTGGIAGTAPTLEESDNGVKNAGSAIIASATGALDKASEATTTAMDSTSAAIQGMKPGFAIRPPSKNEEKEIIDTTQLSSTPKIEETAQIAKETVVASATDVAKKTTQAFKPRLEEKKPAKKATPPKQAKAPAKPTKPKNTPVASSTPTGKYSIQLLATSSQSRASKLANTMKGEGYKVFITQTTRSDKVLYRVRVGGHGDRNTAIKAQEGMKKRYQKNFFVQNSLVVSN